MFKDHQLAAFSQPITSLPDTPNLPAQTLKERFDACPQELRESYNGLCAALDDISAARQLGFQRSAGVPADTVQSAIESVQLQVADAVMGVIPSGSVTGDKLAADVQARFSAIESAAQTEAAARQQADTVRGSRTTPPKPLPANRRIITCKARSTRTPPRSAPNARL